MDQEVAEINRKTRVTNKENHQILDNNINNMDTNFDSYIKRRGI